MVVDSDIYMLLQMGYEEKRVSYILDKKKLRAIGEIVETLRMRVILITSKCIIYIMDRWIRWHS